MDRDRNELRVRWEEGIPRATVTTMRATALLPSWRIAAALLVVISRGSLLLMAALVFLVQPPISAPRLIRLFSAFFLVPGAAAWAVQRLFAVTVLIEPAAIALLQGRKRRVDVSLGTLDAVVPWRIPLPAPGLWLRLTSGRRLRYGLSLADPGTLLSALADAGAPDHVRHVARHRTFLYARSKRSAWRRWDAPVLKFVVFALVPTLPLFRLHQYLAYGGTFGEYYQYGLRAYVLGFGIYWLLLTIYLVLYAAVLRGMTEIVSIAATCVAPARGAGGRRVAEIAHRILYYGGVPVVLILRLWPW